MGTLGTDRRTLDMSLIIFTAATLTISLNKCQVPSGGHVCVVRPPQDLVSAALTTPSSVGLRRLANVCVHALMCTLACWAFFSIQPMEIIDKWPTHCLPATSHSYAALLPSVSAHQLHSWRGVSYKRDVAILQGDGRSSSRSPHRPSRDPETAREVIHARPTAGF